MAQQVTIIIHSITEDGIPDTEVDASLVGRVAFLFDGNIVSGWPLHVDVEDHSTPYSGHWEADSDVGKGGRFANVTHWVEFPRPVWDYERSQPDANKGA